MATTENRLAKIDTGGFNFPALIEREQALEVFQANMEGVEMQFERIKMPSGGGLAFEVIDDSGEVQYVKELIGIILDHYPVNAYWADAYGEGDDTRQPPDCVASNGKNGIATPESGLTGGPCKQCPLNQWGTGRQKDGSLGKGKACRNLHRVYILLASEGLPSMIALPPTSLSSFHDHMRRLLKRLKPHYTVVTRIKLQKAKNTGGTEYSHAIFGTVGEFPPQTVTGIKEIIEQMKPAMRAQRIDATDYEVDVAPAGQAGTSGVQPPSEPPRTEKPTDDGEPFDL